jgi:Fe-S-cluster-containing dehydrogenase component
MGVKRLLIDTGKMEEHREKCPSKCSYYYHPGNDGILSLEEMVTYALICRRCERENCVTSCPFEALEKGPDKILRRSNMRCTSCKTCSHACHSGVILPEFIPYMSYNCDLCLDRLEEGELPECVGSCSCGAIQYGDFKQDEENNMYAIGKNIIVRSVHWVRK